MRKYWRGLLTLVLIGQIIGMREGWPLSREIGTIVLSHWSLAGLTSAAILWLYYHWYVATLFVPPGQRTAPVRWPDYVVFVLAFAFGVVGHYIRTGH